MADERGQLSLSVVEALLGVLLVLGAAAAFTLTPPEAATREVQLDRYARDTLAVLQSDAPVGVGRSRLTALARSVPSFEREREATDERIRAVLPGHLSYRLTTPRGALGDPVPPAGTTVGRATAQTPDGQVTLRVWSL